MSAIKRRARPRPRNPARKKREWARAYGSPERVEWVQGLPCLVCRDAPSENAHTASGGTSRKGDASSVVPLCSRCHGELHRAGRVSFEACYGLDLSACAQRIAQAWEQSA